MFELANSCMSEAAFNELINQLSTDDSYTAEAIAPVDSLLGHWHEEGNRFLIPELGRAATTLVRALTELCDFTAAQFFVYPRAQQSGNLRFCLKPAWNMEREGSGDVDEARKYSELRKHLDEVCARAKVAFKSYRKTAKAILLV